MIQSEKARWMRLRDAAVVEAGMKCGVSGRAGMWADVVVKAVDEMMRQEEYIRELEVDAGKCDDGR